MPIRKSIVAKYLCQVEGCALAYKIHLVHGRRRVHVNNADDILAVAALVEASLVKQSENVELAESALGTDGAFEGDVESFDGNGWTFV